jgi:hypothetical protein
LLSTKYLSEASPTNAPFSILFSCRNRDFSAMASPSGSFSNGRKDTVFSAIEDEEAWKFSKRHSEKKNSGVPTPGAKKRMCDAVYQKYS